MLDVEPRPEGLVFVNWLEDDLTLTPIETRIVRVLGLRFGLWVPSIAIVRAVYRDRGYHADLIDADLATLRTHLWRIRKKLHGTNWRIDNRYWHGLYRVVTTHG